MQSTFERSSKAKKTADSKTCGLFLLVEFKVASGVVRVEFYSLDRKEAPAALFREAIQAAYEE